MNITVLQAQSALQLHEGKTFLELFRQGSMSVDIYVPVSQDPQQPHVQSVAKDTPSDGFFAVRRVSEAQNIRIRSISFRHPTGKYITI